MCSKTPSHKTGRRINRRHYGGHPPPPHPPRLYQRLECSCNPLRLPGSRESVPAAVSEAMFTVHAGRSLEGLFVVEVGHRSFCPGWKSWKRLPRPRLAPLRSCHLPGSMVIRELNGYNCPELFVSNRPHWDMMMDSRCRCQEGCGWFPIQNTSIIG